VLACFVHGHNPIKKKTIICKDWEKTSLLQSFNPNFQIEALGMNELLNFYSHQILHKN